MSVRSSIYRLIRRHVIDDVPTKIDACESCHRVDCTVGDAVQCPRVCALFTEEEQRELDRLAGEMRRVDAELAKRRGWAS